MSKILLLVSQLLVITACSTPSTQSDTSIRANYLMTAKRKIPDLDKYTYQFLLGELNKDGIKDAVIEYGYGEGVRPVGKKLLFLLSSDQSVASIIPYHPIYCPQIDTILNTTLWLTEYSDCITGQGIPIGTRKLEVKEGIIQEMVTWSLKDDLIQSLIELTKDLETETPKILQGKYGLDFSKFGSSIEQESGTLLEILSYNNLKQLKEEAEISFMLEREEAFLTYEIKQFNDQITLTEWYKHIEQLEMGESMIRYEFIFKEGQLQFIDLVRAG